MQDKRVIYAVIKPARSGEIKNQINKLDPEP